eukprot:13757036-Alexandrium_andersonii.AAC.1
MARHREVGKDARKCPCCRSEVVSADWQRLEQWGGTQDAAAPAVLVIGGGAKAGGTAQALVHALAARRLTARAIAARIVEDAANAWTQTTLLAGASAGWGVRAVAQFDELEYIGRP